MHDLVELVKQQVAVAAVGTPLRQVARKAEVNYWWLIKFHKNETSGVSSKGLAHVEKLAAYFRQQEAS